MFKQFASQCIGEIVKVQKKEENILVQHGHGVKILGCND